MSVKKNDILLVNIAGIHRRADIYENPESFSPERFTLEREKDLPRLGYMPFGAGPRVCIGNHFALMEGQLMLATYAQHVRNAFLPVLLVSLPIAGFLFAEPAGVLRFLFGERWLPAAPILRVMSLAIAVASIGRLAYWVSLSLGQAGRTFQWTLRATPIFLACVLVGARWGAEGTANGVAVANVITSVPCVYFLLSTTGVRVGPVLHTWVVPLLASAGGAGMLRVLDTNLRSAETFAGLVIRGLVFVGTYVVLLLVIPGGRGMLRGLRQQAAGAPAVTSAP